MKTQHNITLQALLEVAHKEYRKRLQTYAFFKVNDQTISEDLVQDTFLKTWIYLLRGGKIEMMKAFLYHVLNNLIIDEYRKPKLTSLDSLLEKGFDLASNESERIFNVSDGKSALHMILQLPQKYRKIMKMRYIKNFTLKEMSLITGETKNNVAVQTHRGLEKLKVLYKRVK
jgi:RNA polymerase sigma-70 factor (ECF subfamily)